MVRWHFLSRWILDHSVHNKRDERKMRGFYAMVGAIGIEWCHSAMNCAVVGWLSRPIGAFKFASPWRWYPCRRSRQEKGSSQARREFLTARSSRRADYVGKSIAWQCIFCQQAESLSVRWGRQCRGGQSIIRSFSSECETALFGKSAWADVLICGYLRPSVFRFFSNADFHRWRGWTQIRPIQPLSDRVGFLEQCLICQADGDLAVIHFNIFDATGNSVFSDINTKVGDKVFSF